jgi:hypothetical protein
MTITNKTQQLEKLSEAYRNSTPGMWQQGQTSHHTVTETGHKIGEFHYACDADFCDAAHELVPALLAEVATLRAAIAQPAVSGGVKQAAQLCEWIAETPHVRGSINGLAAQVLHALSVFTQVAPAQAAGAWQLIETAPKTGEWLIVFDSTGEVHPEYWIGEEINEWAKKPRGAVNTHWMPLPPPPPTPTEWSQP